MLSIMPGFILATAVNAIMRTAAAATVHMIDLKILDAGLDFSS